MNNKTVRILVVIPSSFFFKWKKWFGREFLFLLIECEEKEEETKMERKKVTWKRMKCNQIE